MKFRHVLARTALAATCSVALLTSPIAAPAHAASPGDLGDGNGDGVADVWVTIDDAKYTGAVERNGVTEFYASQFPNTKWQYLSRRSAKDVGLGSASAVSALPDVSGDRRADVLARFGERMFIYTSAADGTLTRRQEVGHGWGSFDSVSFAGRLNGDATNYLLARRSTDGSLWAYTISSSGTVVGAGQVGHGWGRMRFLLGAGQMVGDAKADFVAIDRDGLMWCYRGAGKGVIYKQGQCGHGWKGFVTAFVAGDMTEDGRWDIVGVKPATHPNANGEPVIPAGKTLSDLAPEDRSPAYLYRNGGNGTWSTVGRIGHDMFQFRLFA